MSMFTLFYILVVLISGIDAYKSYNKTHYVYLDEWGTIDAKLKNGRVMYSNCTSKGATVKNCTVVMEKSSSSNDSYVCDISLKSEHAKGNVGNKMKLLGGLDDDKILFFWQENNKRFGRYFIYGILNMKTCAFAKVTFDKKLVNRKITAAMYDSCFDVFYKNTSHCGEKICRITYDADGNVINKLHSFVEGNLTGKNWVLQPVYEYNDSLDKSYFYVRVEQTNNFTKNNITTAYYFVKNGTSTLLKRLDGQPEISISIAENVITACATYKQNNGNINCLTFKPESNRYSTTTLSSNDNNNKRVLSIKNTADGNVLILYKTNNSNEDTYNYNYTRHILAKFNHNGKMLSNTTVQIYCDKSLNMLKDEEGNYCIVNGCTKEPDNMWGEKEINFNYQCFDDNDLS